MAPVTSTKIYRGGKSTNLRTLENTQVTIDIDSIRQSVDVRFSIASKGGGRTAIIAAFSKGEFPTLIKNMCAISRIDVVKQALACLRPGDVKMVVDHLMDVSPDPSAKAFLGALSEYVADEQARRKRAI